MIKSKTELAAIAFDAVGNLRRSRTFKDLDTAAIPILKDLGFTYASVVKLFNVDKSPHRVVRHTTVDLPWASIYFGKGYNQYSQIEREILRTNSPYSWSEVLSRIDINDDTRRMLKEAKRFGCTDGLYLPIREDDGSYSAVIFWGAKAYLEDPLVRSMIEVVAEYYGLEVRRLLKSGGDGPPRLSGRQRECLTWVRHGKSSADISNILGVSVATVDGHVAEACRKLGVRTRVQAAVEACRLGLIDW